jgi:2-hydroxychromene-2-carboxylate isomerase
MRRRRWPGRSGFYFDFASPYSYLASTQLKALAKRADANVEYVPISVLEVMKLVDNTPTTIISKAKGAYAMADIGRWVTRYQIPFSTDRAQRKVDNERLLAGAAIAVEAGEAAAYADAVYQGVWGAGPVLADDATLGEVLRKAGLGCIEAILAGRERGEAIIAANVKAAAETGVFGAPSFTVDGQLYFGNDRLGFLEEALAA